MASRSVTLPHPGTHAGAATSRPRRLPGRRAIRRAVALLVLLALAAGGGWWWLRDSPIAAVKDVTINGVTGPQADAIRAALTTAAQDMSTLHVQEAGLRTAVAPYPIVADVTATGDFPHGLTITVREHEPVASLRAGGQTLAVAADGTLLRGTRNAGLPTIAVATLPAGAHLADALALAQVRILAAAPAALRARVTKVFTGSRGLALQLKDGPAVAFGAAERLPAKWLSLAAVLAEPSSAGGTLIDLSVPERPAVVGLPPLAGSTTTGTTTDPTAPAVPGALDPADETPAVSGTGVPSAPPVPTTP
jgi:cell division protein FtsQ